MTKLSTEAKPLEREMFVAREVLRLGVIRVLTMFPVDSPVRRALAEILVKTADEQFDYAAACDEYQTDPAFYNAVERIRCHLTAALLKRNDEQETQLAVMREAIRWARDELFAHGYAQGESARYDKIIKRLESALTPDDGKRVEHVRHAHCPRCGYDSTLRWTFSPGSRLVDVELLRDLVGLLHSLTNDPMLRISIQVFLDKLAALIGEGDA